MTLITKSIQLPVSKKDGIRICIMRRPSKYDKYDIWIPVLSPSNRLLTDYHQKKVDWLRFEKRFRKEVIKKQKKFLKLLADISQKNTITILCWEKTPEFCHRRLILEEVNKLQKRKLK